MKLKMKFIKLIINISKHENFIHYLVLNKEI